MELTLAENLLYSTAKLTALKAGNVVSTGSGFFMSFAAIGDRSVPAIVTNRHVLRGCDTIRVVCHLEDENGRPSGELANCDISISNRSVVHHFETGVDLCAIPFGLILHQAKDAGKPIFFRPLPMDLVPKEDDWQYFDAIEEITMIGCPNGISDEVNNFPIVRRGITASSLSKRYDSRDEFMVDIACYPGSSGSPIFVYDRNGYLDRKTNTFRLGEQRLKLVGILYAGPQITNTGNVVLMTPPAVTVPSMMHLGNAIRASALYRFDTFFREASYGDANKGVEAQDISRVSLD